MHFTNRNQNMFQYPLGTRTITIENLLIHLEGKFNESIYQY